MLNSLSRWCSAILRSTYAGSVTAAELTIALWSLTTLALTPTDIPTIKWIK